MVSVWFCNQSICTTVAMLHERACGMHGMEFLLPHDLLQALITNALQAVLPPNCIFTAVTMIQKLNSNTVIVNAQFKLWESQLAVLLANKCCDLEVLFLQQAVQRIDPTVDGKVCSCRSDIGFCFAVVDRLSSSMPCWFGTVIFAMHHPRHTLERYLLVLSSQV